MIIADDLHYALCIVKSGNASKTKRRKRTFRTAFYHIFRGKQIKNWQSAHWEIRN